jgi:class 3 adenylate cyclase
VGSLSYASPEQLEGEDHIDGRTDIYALGSVLFEMLTGRPPLPATPDAATILRFSEEGPPSVRAIRPSVSASLDTAIRRSLSRLPADRFASAGEFARSIREAARAATGPEDSSRASGAADGRRLSAVFALDMASYSRLVERDEADTLARHRKLRAAVIDPAIHEFRGRIVKGTGDGLLAEFASALEAVECAARIQERMVGETEPQTEDDEIRYRIGINIGDVIAADGDIFGAGVNIAARVESLAMPGGVAISENVYMQVRNQVPYSFEDLGPVTLKNLEQPVRVFRLAEGLRGAGSGLTEPKSAWRRLVERARGR